MKNDSVSEEYSKAVVEVLTILKLLPKEEKKKIPNKLVAFFMEVASKSYHPDFDFSQGIENIDLMDKTKHILAMLYLNYWCEEEERKSYNELILKNEISYQEGLKQKYPVDNLFKKRSKFANNTHENTFLPTPIKKEAFYKKVLNFVKRILSL
ncbi:MAG: hypothetical protein HFJ37_01155 [Clostridia bacterium]|nr:hypothetical protein [Clostridia bacterium]